MMLVCPDERNQHAEWRAHLGSAAQRRIEHDLSKIGSNIAASHKRATRPTASTPLRKIILFNEYIGDVTTANQQPAEESSLDPMDRRDSQ